MRSGVQFVHEGVWSDRQTRIRRIGMYDMVTESELAEFYQMDREQLIKEILRKDAEGDMRIKTALEIIQQQTNRRTV